MPESPDTAPAAGATEARAPRLLSLIVPVLNEEAVVELFLERLAPALAECRTLMGQGARTEIVFVDDGSTDGTAAAILGQRARNPDIKLIRMSRNFGKDAALTAGLAYARGDAVIPLDVDLQDPPEVIPRMVERWLAGARIVNARRVDRGGDGWLKRLSAGSFYRLYNAVAAFTIPENVGDFRLIDRAAVDVLNRLPERNRFMKGLIPWVGFEQATVDYVRPPRAAGQTKWGYWRLWNFALDGITASTTAPLRIWTYLGLVVALAAFGYALFVIVKTLIYGIDVPGYASLMVVVLMLGGINMLAVGILGEYVGRIAADVRQRPLFVVAEAHGFGEERAVPGDGEPSPAVPDHASV